MNESIIVPVLSEVIVSRIIFIGGYFIGKYKERKNLQGKNLEEYYFYPFDVDRNNIPQFSLKDFRLGIHYLLKVDDTNEFRENYKNIVRLIGHSFPDIGIEILLHNLVNPSPEIKKRLIEMSFFTFQISL